MVLMRSVLSSIYVVVLQNSIIQQRLGIHSLNSPSKNQHRNLFFRKLSLNRRKKPKGHIFRQNVLPPFCEKALKTSVHVRMQDNDNNRNKYVTIEGQCEENPFQDAIICGNIDEWKVVEGYSDYAR